MTENKWQWWMIAAVLIAASEVVLSIGNVVAYLGDEKRSLGSSMIAAAGGLVLATLIVGGLLLRRRGRRSGSVGVAAGALPGCGGLMLWWFPPAVAIGMVSLAVVLFALADALRDRQAAATTGTTA